MIIRQSDKIIGVTFGVWDLLHAGHVLFLADCKAQCDELHVGLQTSTAGRKGKNAPVQTALERFIQLEGCKYVDKVFPYETETDLEVCLQSFYFDVRFLGSDYRDLPEKITGFTICENLGIGIVYIDRNHHYSSSELRGRISK